MEYFLTENINRISPSTFIRIFFTVYNFGKTGSGNLAVYASAGVIGKGGTVKWNGTACFDELALRFKSMNSLTIISINNKVEASSLYLGFNAGYNNFFTKNLNMDGKKLNDNPPGIEE